MEPPPLVRPRPLSSPCIMVAGSTRERGDPYLLAAALCLLDVLEGPPVLRVHPLPGVARTARRVAERLGYGVLPGPYPWYAWPPEDDVDLLLLHRSLPPPGAAFAEPHVRSVQGRARLRPYRTLWLDAPADLWRIVQTLYQARLPPWSPYAQRPRGVHEDRFVRRWAEMRERGDPRAWEVGLRAVWGEMERQG